MVEWLRVDVPFPIVKKAVRMSERVVPPIETEVTKTNRVIGFGYEGSVLVIRVEPELKEEYEVSDSEESVRPTSLRGHTFRVQELGLPWLKVEYEVTHFTCYYVNRYKHNSSFTIGVFGIESKLKVSRVLLSTAMQMLVVQNLPLEVVQELLLHNVLRIVCRLRDTRILIEKKI